MLSGVRFRAYPAAALQATLRVWIGHQRFIYNAKTREHRYWARFARHSLALTGCKPLPDQAYSQFVGDDTSWLRDAPSQVLRNGAYRFANATSRMLKGLGGAPRIKKKHGRQSVLLTSELFRFKTVTDPLTGEVRTRLELGTAAHPVGVLPFQVHRPYTHPKMLVVSVEPDGRWFVSFCFESVLPQEPEFLRSPEELAYEYGQHPGLEALTVGIDRGVALPLAVSDGQTFELDPVCVARVKKKDARARRYQKRMARQTRGSCGYRKSKRRIARLKAYGSEVLADFAHKASSALANSDAHVFVFEDLRLKNMTAAPAPKLDAAGRYAPDGAAAKAGLNKALLSSALGQTLQLLTYKAARRNKLVVKVPAHYSSQECAACGHTSAENRPSQSQFLCTACGHADNADLNAARVLKARGVRALRSGEVRFKKPKTARVRGRQVKVGPGRPEPDVLPRPTPVESSSDAVCHLVAHRAVLAETGDAATSARWAPGSR